MTPVYDLLAGRSGTKIALQLLCLPIQASSPAASSPGFGFGDTSLSHRMKETSAPRFPSKTS